MTKERPILFNSDMVKAILEGRKTQTRRVAFKGVTGWWLKELELAPLILGKNGWFSNGFVTSKSPYGLPGERLWVRETFGQWAGEYVYKASQTTHPKAATSNWKWTPSIHMPRDASRILLEITDIRVERIQEISESDCWAEGINDEGDAYLNAEHLTLAVGGCPEKSAFRDLWDSINAKQGYGWDSNPWVWVVEFKPLEVTE